MVKTEKKWAHKPSIDNHAFGMSWSNKVSKAQEYYLKMLYHYNKYSHFLWFLFLGYAIVGNNNCSHTIISRKLIFVNLH